MSKVKVVLNRNNVKNAIRKSHEMKELLTEVAENIQKRCGDGYATEVVYYGTEVRVNVYTATPEAMRNNLENNTLLKASRA